MEPVWGPSEEPVGFPMLKSVKIGPEYFQAVFDGRKAADLD